MKGLSLHIAEALTFDDVLLVPKFSTVLPRDADVAISLCPDLSLSIPILSAAMDTVTESRLAIALSQNGGIGVIHKNMTAERQAQEVQLVKKYESGVVQDPITINPDASIAELLALTKKHAISGVPVVNTTKNTVVGIVTNRDMRFITDLQRPVSSIMTTQDKLISVTDSADIEKAKNLMYQHRIEKILVVNDTYTLKGMITVKDIEKAARFPNSCKDSYGRLRVGAAVGTTENDQDRIDRLVASSVDALVIDTAHGHSQSVIECVKATRKKYPKIYIIAGNIATDEAAVALADAGANIVKVGMGPGSICTTRIVAGVGIPQVTAIQNVAHALAGSTIGIVADGGIRFSGDVAKAIAAGAHAVMIGSLFAGADESPGDTELYQGRAYKNYRGMGSIGAMKDGSSDRYFQYQLQQEKLVPEGIEGRVPAKGSLAGIIDQLIGGLRSSMGYTGCANIEQLRTETNFVRISNAGMKESHVHDVQIVRESPNYNL